MLRERERERERERFWNFEIFNFFSHKLLLYIGERERERD